MAAPSSEQLLSRLVEIAEDQLRWQRAAALPDVRRTIDQTLSTTGLRQAYELLDGTRTGTDLARAVGSSQPTLSRWIGRWRDLGIAYDYVDPEGRRRTKHLVSLEDLGLPIELEAD